MASKNISTTNEMTANVAQGLSLAELETEAISTLPEREEMSGCNRWFNCWHPCYDYSPCYDFNHFNQFGNFSQFSR